ncbi:hypothetical protein [Streptomyces sp. NBRC 110028]|uniref:hypothetical protein n=1 Tax=Streptomyces sp. NBRC 110028 TaxID=1621260 RepID=UPI0006E28626|nr:hypothetical protein [Streptomyces sp. NBRC 110028]
MRPAGSRTTGRRGTALATSAVALCLGALLGGCAGSGQGHVATGAAGPGDGRAPTKAVPPEGGVDLVPLDRGDDSGERRRTDDESAPGTTPGTTGAEETSGAPPSTASSTRTPGPSASASSRPPSTGSAGEQGGEQGGQQGGERGGDGDTGPGGSGSTGGRTDDEPAPSSPPGGTSPAPSTPSGPAALKVGDPERTATDERWCEKVTVEFRNTGGLPVVSGKVTLSTHVVDALGLDWATLESKRKLPAPIGAGQKRVRTWKVCVDAWRVPLGMHIETRDVSVDWKPWEPPKPRKSGASEAS